MNNTKKLIFIFLIFFSILSCEEFFIETKMQNLLIEFLNYSNSGNSHKAALLFYYNKNQSKEEFGRKKKMVTLMIDNLTKRFGTINISHDVSDSNLIKFEISACDSAFLSNKPFVKAGIFPMKFEKLGYGWIEIQIILDDSEVKIRKLIFKVPDSK